MIIIAIVFTILALLTVIGNFMVRLWKYRFQLNDEGCTSFSSSPVAVADRKIPLDAIEMRSFMQLFWASFVDCVTT